MGVKAAALTLAKIFILKHSQDWREWHPTIRKARSLSESLFTSWSDALLYRTLRPATGTWPVFDTVEDLCGRVRA